MRMTYTLPTDASIVASSEWFDSIVEEHDRLLERGVDFESLARIAYRMFEGDDVNDQLMTILRKHKLIDENDEWVYVEKEDGDGS